MASLHRPIHGLRGSMLLASTILSVAALPACSVGPANSNDAGDTGTSGDDSANDDGETDGGTGPQDDGTASAWPSERLHLEVQRLGDAEHVLGFWDTELDLRCTMRRIEGGHACVPTTEAQRYYADADCKVPVVRSPDSACDPDAGFTSGQWVSTVVSDCTEPVYEVLELTNAFDGPVYEHLDLGGCSEVTFPDGTSIFATKVADTSRLVSAREELEVHGELAVRMAYAQDGARQAMGFARPDGSQCDVASSEEATTHACIPARRIDYLPFFNGGPNCEGPPVAVWSEQLRCDVSQVPDIIVAEFYEADDFCPPPDLVVRERGDRFDEIGFPFEGVCQSGPTVGWSLGEKVDIAATYPTPQAHRRGTGPFARYFGPGESSVDVQFDGFELTDGSACRPVPFADGSSRCVPNDVLLIERPIYFTDAECTETLLRTGFESCDPTPEHVIRAEWPQVECGPVGHEVFELSAYEGPVYDISTGSCQRADPELESTRRFARIGGPVPDTVFPEVVTEIR